MPILNVPYTSQQGGGANARVNDCGPVCIKTLIEFVARQQKKVVSLTVDQLSLETPLKTSDTGLSLGDLHDLAQLHQIAVHYADVSLDAIHQQIAAGLPFLIEVRYSADFAHFVVVVGYDGVGIYVHDPWYGAYRHWTTAQFLAFKSTVGMTLDALQCPPAQPLAIYAVTVGALYVRQAASTTARALTVLPYHATVWSDGVGKSSDGSVWAHVTYPVTGYMCAITNKGVNYLKGV